MKLEDFISESLSQIARGVVAAQKKANDTGTLISPYINEYFDSAKQNPNFIGEDRNRNLVQIVDFDVAVTVESGTETSGGIRVVAGILGLGSEGKSKKKDNTVSRLKFAISFSLPNEFKK